MTRAELEISCPRAHNQKCQNLRAHNRKLHGLTFEVIQGTESYQGCVRVSLL